MPLLLRTSKLWTPLLSSPILQMHQTTPQQRKLNSGNSARKMAGSHPFEVPFFPIGHEDAVHASHPVATLVFVSLYISGILRT